MKAQGLAINVVIMAVMALSVLMFVTTFMSGGFKGTTDKVTTFSRESMDAGSAGRSVKCNTDCAMWISKKCKASFIEGEDSLLNGLNAACECGSKSPQGTQIACKDVCACPES